MAITAQNLIDRARQRADFVSSTFLTDSTELLSWCEDSYKELWDLLAEAYGENYLLVLSNIDVADRVVQLGSALIHKLIRVDRVANDRRVPLRAFDFADVVFSEETQAWESTIVEFNLVGDSVWFNPVPAVTETVSLYYVPQAALTTLTGGTGTISVQAEPWAEYIVIDLAIKMRVKEETDTSDLRLDKEAMRRRIISAGTPRDVTRARRTVDVRYFDEEQPDVWDEIWP